MHTFQLFLLLLAATILHIHFIRISITLQGSYTKLHWTILAMCYKRADLLLQHCKSTLQKLPNCSTAYVNNIIYIYICYTSSENPSHCMGTTQNRIERCLCFKRACLLRSTVLQTGLSPDVTAALQESSPKCSPAKLSFELHSYVYKPFVTPFSISNNSLLFFCSSW